MPKAGLFALAALVFLTSCTVGPDYVKPSLDTPSAWRLEYEAAVHLADLPWWEGFGDPVLNSLIQDALQENKDLKIAAARVEQFLGALDTTRSQFFPQISGKASVSRQKDTETGPTPFPPGVSPTYNTFQVVLNVTWEIDVWGRIRRATESARAQVLASEEGRRAVVLTLVANVASNYLTLRALDRQLEITRETEKTYARTLDLFNLRHQYGTISRLELSQIESQYESARQAIPQVQSQITQQENLISILIGRNPGAIPRGRTIDELVPVGIPGGLPSTLLERRPDIRQAEQNLVAANANIGAAKALYFPVISLTGILGTASAELSRLFEGPSTIWSSGSRGLRIYLHFRGNLRAGQAGRGPPAAGLFSVPADGPERLSGVRGRPGGNDQGPGTASVAGTADRLAERLRPDRPPPVRRGEDQLLSSPGRGPLPLLRPAFLCGDPIERLHLPDQDLQGPGRRLGERGRQADFRGRGFREIAPEVVPESGILGYDRLGGFLMKSRWWVLFTTGILYFTLTGSVVGAKQPPARQDQEAPSAKTAHPTRSLSSIAAQKWTGDLDGLIKRRVIRALVPYSKTFYFVDRGAQRGLAYEALRVFEDDLNKALKRKYVRVHLIFLPVSREEIIPYLREGKGDIAVANLTITPQRLKAVDFSAPTAKNVSEIVITGPASRPLADKEALSGQEVYVRKSSSFYESLEQLNTDLARQKKPPVRIRSAPENLEVEDLLEMVNAGLVKATVVDSHIAEFWKQVFSKIVLHPEAALRTGGEIGWMFRKNSPKLKAAVNKFLARYPEGSKQRNLLLQKYLKSAKYVTDATSQAEMAKFERTVDFFRKFGGQYGMDYLLMMAQGYQESRLDQNAKSQAGAVGIMQVMPATGQEMKVGDIRQVEPNIHAGVKYIRFMVDQHYKDDPIDPLNKGVFAFAAYNAGPNRIDQFRKLAAKRQLNPNVWFNNVELMAAEKIGRETVTYVSNIYKYYLAYHLVMEEEKERREAVDQIKKEAK